MTQATNLQISDTLKTFFWRMGHFGPLFGLYLIVSITCTTVYASYLWWPPFGSDFQLESVACLIFLGASGSTVLVAFFASVIIDPGYVPRGWKPENPEDCVKLQYCAICRSYKAPRSHHCRKCSRCCLKLDHHCMFTYNCIGHCNQFYFVLFLISTVIGCLEGFVVQLGALLNVRRRLGFISVIWLASSSLLTAITVICAGLLLYYQLRAIARNQTYVEEHIMEKAKILRATVPKLQPFINPYDLGWRSNLIEFLELSPQPHNGMEWTVRAGCDQYTMTLEHLRQKRYKKLIAFEYLAVDD